MAFFFGEMEMTMITTGTGKFLDLRVEHLVLSMEQIEEAILLEGWFALSDFG